MHFDNSIIELFLDLGKAFGLLCIFTTLIIIQFKMESKDNDWVNRQRNQASLDYERNLEFYEEREN